MQARFVPGTLRAPEGLVSQLPRLVVLVLPAALLAVVGVRQPAAAQLLWLGVTFQALGCLLVLVGRHLGRESSGPAVIMLYVIALVWLLLTATAGQDWLIHLVQAVLLVVPLGFFGLQCLRDSGATMVRRARRLAGRIARRPSWPADLLACRELPEVKALREAVALDAAPALELLANPKPAVRVAALTALEFRPNWRPGQAQVVLQLARRAAEPEVRAAAVFALAAVDDRVLIESLAELLRDPTPLVRHTTAEALLCNVEAPWYWYRDALRQALGEAAWQEDGPLPLPNLLLPEEALTDLHAWAGEKGPIAVRAAVTLGAYYGQRLATGGPPGTVERLRAHATDPRTPPMLRLELARLLQHFRELTPHDLRQLLDSTTPAPVRLIAADAILALGDSPEAVASLHELARLPNREIALSTADVVQRRCGIDLGLPRGQAAPPVQSRAAAEVARRLLAWTTQQEIGDRSGDQWSAIDVP